MCASFFKKNTMTFRPKDQSIKLSSLDAMNKDDGKRGKKDLLCKKFLCLLLLYNFSSLEKKCMMECCYFT